MTQQNLPENDHIARFVPWSKVDKDADDNVRGILYTAYEPRMGESSLSVNWLERTGELEITSALRATAQLIDANLTVGNKGRLAVSNVGRFKEICAQHNHKVRIVHAPVANNEPHSEVRQISQNDLSLLGDLASMAVVTHHRCKDLL